MKNIPVLITLSVFGLFAASGRADTLGTAVTYAVLGASTVTNTGSSVLTGDLGLYPGTSITGFPPGSVSGTINNDNGPAMTAQGDALTFYNYLAGLSGGAIAPNLSGVTLTPGTYSTGAALLPVDGELTLNFEGLNNQTIVLQASELTTQTGSVVDVENLGMDDNVYYQVGSSATLGSYSVFQGDIIALTSISLDPYADITCGSAIALNGAVTLISNKITNCATTTGSSTGTPTGTDVTSVNVTPTPEPGSLWLLSTGLLAGAGVLRRRFIA